MALTAMHITAARMKDNRKAKGGITKGQGSYARETSREMKQGSGRHAHQAIRDPRERTANRSRHSIPSRQPGRCCIKEVRLVSYILCMHHLQEEREMSLVIIAYALVDPCRRLRSAEKAYRFSCVVLTLHRTPGQPIVSLASRVVRMEHSQDSGGHTLARSGCISYSDGTSHNRTSAPFSSPPSPKFELIRRTSGLISPHRLHLVVSALVTCMSSDHLTPVNARCFAALLFFAHRIPLPAIRGGSSTNPGEMVHT